jgi:predicted metalloprotease with PDZ domain
LLRRSGLIDDSRYLKLLARTISAVAATPGRLTQSVAQASFDAWVKYYRGDENTPNATISYYAKGSLVALALDLTLRAEGKGSLDEVMRMLWQRSAGGPIDEDDIAAALEAVGGRSFAGELEAWVHGRKDLPLPALLQAAGVEWQASPPTFAQRIGVRVSESPLTGIKVSHVLQGGIAERAGLTAGDEILALEGWRVRRLDEAMRVIGTAPSVQILLARDQRVIHVDLALTAESTSSNGAVTLKPAPQSSESALALLRAWLSG